jgi:hypothetical protein
MADSSIVVVALPLKEILVTEYLIIDFQKGSAAKFFLMVRFTGSPGMRLLG